MEITKIYITKNEDENSKVKGHATVILNDGFAIHNIKIIEGKDRLFIAMPSRKDSKGEYKDIVHPTNHEARVMLEEAIIKEYSKDEN
ncbi:MAG: septation protein SpoVG [Bacilli bacterium]|nr:septation protein SpoVG [Bacilli bacterium]